jgi:hypothetical protein
LHELTLRRLRQPVRAFPFDPSRASMLTCPSHRTYLLFMMRDLYTVHHRESARRSSPERTFSLVVWKQLMSRVLRHSRFDSMRTLAGGKSSVLRSKNGIVSPAVAFRVLKSLELIPVFYPVMLLLIANALGEPRDPALLR